MINEAKRETNASAGHVQIVIIFNLPTMIKMFVNLATMVITTLTTISDENGDYDNDDE